MRQGLRPAGRCGLEAPSALQKPSLARREALRLLRHCYPFAPRPPLRAPDKLAQAQRLLPVVVAAAAPRSACRWRSTKDSRLRAARRVVADREGKKRLAN